MGLTLKEKVEAAARQKYWQQLEHNRTTAGYPPGFKPVGSPGSPIKAIQGALDLVGVIPIVGDIADGVNGMIYLFRGETGNAAISFAAVFVPAASGLRYADEVGDVIRRVNPNDVRFTQLTANQNLQSGPSRTIQELISAINANPRIVHNLRLEVVEHNGTLFSLNNRRLVALQNSNVNQIDVRVLSLDDRDVMNRFLDQTEHGLLNDGQTIMIVPSANHPLYGHGPTRRFANENGAPITDPPLR